MSYSRRLDNVLQQIDYVENKINKDLINEFSKYLGLNDASAKLSTNCQNHLDVWRIYIRTKRSDSDSN